MIPFGSQQPVVADRRLLVGVVGLLTAAAWMTLWRLGDLVHAFAHQPAHQHLHGAPPMGAGTLLLLFVAGWTVMTIAMMLPTSLPVISIFHALARERRDRALLVGLVIGGYLLTWILFGVAVYGATEALQRLATASRWIDAHSGALGAGILLLAGIYQFTPLKYRCLEKCRSPFSFVVEHWQGRDERWQAFRLGVDHGMFCVGCCWTLMLLMFVVGFGNLAWMFLLGAVMGVEKNVQWGRRLSAPIGVALLGWSVMALVL